MSPGAAHSISPTPPSLGAAEIVSGSAHSRLGQPAAAVKMVPTFKKVAVGAGKFEMRKILMPASKTSSPLGGQCCQHLPSPVKIIRLTGLKKLYDRWEEQQKRHRRENFHNKTRIFLVFLVLPLATILLHICSPAQNLKKAFL
jgi:hypothetical protein